MTAPVTSPSREEARDERVAHGHVLLVQEGRFRLLTDEGRGLLLTLTHNANCGIDDLERLKRDKARVEVRYTGEPNLASGAAHEIKQTPAGPEPLPHAAGQKVDR